MKRKINDSTAIIMILVLLLALQVSCKVAAQSKTFKNIDQNNFLKGYWNYANGSQAFYDGISNSAKGTKVPTNNCYHFMLAKIIGKT